MKYLVTGAPGWLGTRFVEALSGANSELAKYGTGEAPEEVRCLVQPGINHGELTKLHENVMTVEGDITDSGSVDKFIEGAEGAILFHIAGIIHPSKGIKQIFDINVMGSSNVLKAAVRNKVKRIIVISSNSPAGVNPHKDHRFDESAPYKPYMAYGRSKMQMEMMLNEANKKGEIETVILRPCWFYGPGQPLRQSLFFTMIKNGGAPIVGAGDGMRSMSYVDNTCQALLLAAKTEKANGETYWIADEKAYSMNDIIGTIENLLETEFGYEVSHKRLRLPNLASSVAFMIDWFLQKVGIYHQKIHVLSEMNKTIACSIKKAKEELGYSPTVELEEGMRRSIKWSLDNGHVI